ncbi:MAG: serine/threonine-protein kinase [Myxococcales bacterium]|nr:serine/threonine-protein kinase [Myxococcales bacterium]
MTLEGRIVGRYRVLRQLAEGGMGLVLLARTDGPAGFTKRVVLKTLHPHLAADQSFLDVFLVEARVCAALSHPNVAQVFELVEDGGEYFLAMEYVRGRSLREVVKARGPLGAAVSLSIVSHVLRALQHAHEARDERGAALHVLHRDVSPENVLLSWDGAVKLVDFGLAGVRGRRAGKEGYIAPEVLDGLKPSVASDLYSTAVVLVECLTGRAAGPAPSLEGVSSSLQAVVTRALEPDPSKRYATAASFADALDEVARAAGDHVTPTVLAQVLVETFDTADDDEAETTPPRRTAVLTGVADVAPAPVSTRRRLVPGLIALVLSTVAVMAVSRREVPAPLAEDPPPVRAEARAAAPVATPLPVTAAPPAPPPSSAPPVAGPPPSARPSLTSKPGTLLLRVIPWANVDVDGKAMGPTPLAPLSLSPGPHHLRLTNPELGVTTTRDVIVKSGSEQQLRVDLLDVLGAQP